MGTKENIPEDVLKAYNTYDSMQDKENQKHFSSDTDQIKSERKVMSYYRKFEKQCKAYGLSHMEISKILIKVA